MSLGDNYNNNEEKKYNPTVYSKYSMSNTESSIDKTGVSYSFNNNLLKISITPLVENKKGGDNKFTYDRENEVKVYLTHTKARLFALQIMEFQKDPDKYNNVGVATGAGLLSLSNGKEFGTNSQCLVIRKISEDGNIECSIAYEFRTQYHKGIVNFNEADMTFDDVFYDGLELDQLLEVLVSYYKSMTGAIAYSVIDSFKYTTSPMFTKLDAICESLGIADKKNSHKGSNSIFSNKGKNTSSTTTATTIDDIESEME